MEITIEQVERLREKANVSYAQAKQALEFSGGNLLDAIIYLEERGSIPRAEGTSWSTRDEAPPPPTPELELEPQQERPPRRSLSDLGRTILAWLIDNEVEVWHRKRLCTAVPVLIMGILMIVFFWILIPVLLCGLFFGFRYRFNGPGLDWEHVNDAIVIVADAAENIGRQVMDEMSSQNKKDKTDQKGS